MKLPTFKPGDVVTAKDWNAIAREVNRIWASRAGPGLTLVKGEPWRIRISDASLFGGTIVANGPIYRVYVWRDDQWDFGSDDDPTAVYLGGAFTTINGQPARRIARLIKNDLTGTKFDPNFSSNTGFDSDVRFISTTKDSPPQLLVGCPLPTLRDGESVLSFAWTLDPASGIYGFSNIRVTWVTGAWQFGTTPLSGVACIAGQIGLLGNSLFRKFDIASGAMGYGSSFGQHLIEATSDRWINTSNGAALSFVIPASPAIGFPGYFDSGCLQSADWAANSGGASLFNAVTNQKQVWDIGLSGREIWFSASTEYGGALSWGAYGDYVDGEPWTAALICVTDDGLITDATEKRLKLMHGDTDRADLCCVDSSGKIWFAGNIYQIKSNTEDTGYNELLANQLYTFDPATQAIQVFDDFNGRVWDCAEFRPGQFIAVGEFTEYKGQPASYIVFLDTNGNRLADLEWP